ncbi:MAG: polyprenyl synthetase family protein [Sandaracinaceae bacterium]
MHPAPALDTPPDLLQRLTTFCDERGLESFGVRLRELAELVRMDMAKVEAGLPRLRADASAVQRGADHLLARGGKRLRPMCIALAAKVGTGFTPAACDLAVAVELVHAATLLHDDVVDLGETRRGAPAARLVFGNTVSIFAGDWLLVDALRRVRRIDPQELLIRLFDTIEEMILAESLQLERRHRLDTTVAHWHDIVRGKTASLFAWGLYAGGRSGGLDVATSEKLATYGRHLGIAFQAIDDLLDLTGDPEHTGKQLFTDLREGKWTYPLLVAMRRDPTLVPRLAELQHETPSPEEARAILDAIEQTGALGECRELAVSHSEEAKRAIESLPPSPAKEGLLTVADATVRRSL